MTLIRDHFLSKFWLACHPFPRHYNQKIWVILRERIYVTWEYSVWINLDARILMMHYAAEHYQMGILNLESRIIMLSHEFCTRKYVLTWSEAQVSMPKPVSPCSSYSILQITYNITLIPFFLLNWKSHFFQEYEIVRRFMLSIIALKNI